MSNPEQMLVDALGSLDEDAVNQLTRQLVDEKVDSIRIEEALQAGMQTVEARYEQGEYFLGDLIVAGSLFVEALKQIPIREKPEGDGAFVGKVLMGVASEDIHDIGKDIVVQVLKSHGFDVLDLGVDVSPERYVEAIEQFKPDIAALSGVMGNSPNEMKRVIDMMGERGLRNSVFVVIGGACASERVCGFVGADAYAEGPIDTLKLCQRYMEQGNRA